MRQGGKDTECRLPQLLSFFYGPQARRLGVPTVPITIPHTARCARSVRPGDQAIGHADAVGVKTESITHYASGAASRGEWSHKSVLT